MVEMNGIDQLEQQQELQQMVVRLADILATAGLSCTTAESCTGGLLAKTFTDVPGSSSWFEQGWITYSNRAKQNLLGVKKQVLDKHGAVSEEVVLAMATAARELADSTISVAISGVAGPGGGSEEKPVGTVWIAWATARQSDAHRYNFEGDRQQVRLFAVQESILGIIERIDTYDVGAPEDRL